MTQGIYEIYCIMNKQRYIGSSRNIEKRWIDHIDLLEDNIHYNFFLQKAWNKYGRENFVFSILEEVSHQKDLFKVEEKYIKQFQFYDLFNIMKKPGAKPRKTSKWAKQNMNKKKQNDKEEYAWGVD